MKAQSKKRRIEASESYLFLIEKLRPTYLFGSATRLVPTKFSEYLHPDIEAVCLSPKRLKDRETRLTIIGDRDIERDLWMQKSAPADEVGIGTLTMRGTESSYLGSVPFDVLLHIQNLIASGTIRFIHLHGAALSRGHARIRSIGFYDELDPDDF